MATLAAAAAAISGFVLAYQRGQDAQQAEEFTLPGCLTAKNCEEEAARLRSEEDDFRTMGFVALGVYGANLLWSAIDAGLSARRPAAQVRVTGTPRAAGLAFEW